MERGWTQRNIDKRLFIKHVLVHTHWQMSLNLTCCNTSSYRWFTFEIMSITPAPSHPKNKKRGEMFGSYLQEIAFDEITLLGQSLKVMAGPLHSLSCPLTLGRTPPGTRKVDCGGPTELGGLAAWPSLWDMFNYHCGMLVCTLVLLCPLRDHRPVLNAEQSPPCPEELISGRW